VAELLGTYFLIFAGCGAAVVNWGNDKVVTLPGISIVWGLAVMVLVYSVGHISGAHFNPAVTIAFATCRRFPWQQVNYTRETFSFLFGCTARTRVN
jgi:aquaporin NIP